MADVESVVFINKSLRDRILSLGAIPQIDDLSKTTAFNILFNQYINLVGTAGGAIGNLLIYRPGALIQENGVFNSWSDLMTAFAQTEGIVTIQIDDSIISPAVIPSGNWDLETRGVISGNITPNNTPIQVQFADGAVLLNSSRFYLNLDLHSVSATPVITITNNQVILMERGARMYADGAAPFIDFPAGVSALILLVLTSEFVTSAREVVRVGAGAVCQFAVLDFSGFQANTIEGDATAILFVIIIDPAAQISNIQPNFLGTFITALIASSALVGYSPANPADWVGPQPDNVASAIDRLAAAVAGLLGGPIP